MLWTPGAGRRGRPAGLRVTAVGPHGAAIRRAPPPTPTPCSPRLDPEQREVAHAPCAVRCACWPAPAPARPGRSPTGSPTACTPGSTRPAACWRSPSPRGRPARCAAGCAQLGVGGVQARTFHSAALRQLQYFWPRVVGGELPQLVERKVAAGRRGRGPRSACRLDRTGLRDLAAEIEWAKVTRTVAGRLRRRGRDAPAATAAGLDAPPRSRGCTPAYEEVKRARGADRLRGRAAADGRRCSRTAATSPSRCAAQYRHFVVDEYQDVNPLQQRLLDLWLGGPRRPVRGRRRQPDDLLLHRRQPRPTCSASRRRYPDAAGGPAGPRLPLDPPGGGAGQRRCSRRHAAGRGGPPRAGRAAARRARSRRSPSYADEPAEAAGVAAPDRRAARRAGCRASEIAVLFRINAQSEAFEQALADAGVPYLLRGARAVLRAARGARGACCCCAAPPGRGRRPDGAGAAGRAVRAVLARRTRLDPASRRPVAARSASAGSRCRARAARRGASPRRGPAPTLADLVAELDERAAAQHAPDRRGRDAGLAARGQGPGVGRGLPGRPGRGH